ncbi:MAG: glycine/sarcosine/betaine reductase selenoprotein B family protein [Vulcanimicrobiaceae bacterium]
MRTPAPALSESWAKWITNSERGLATGRAASRVIALPQLKRLANGEIPWAPLRKPLHEAKVVLISSGGVHLRSDRPFNLNGDGTYRVIPRDATPADLAISHQAYDRTDALSDINLVFPIERLRELQAEHAIGSLAEKHYGFGLSGSAARLIPSMRDVARRIKIAAVDLAILVPA